MTLSRSGRLSPSAAGERIVWPRSAGLTSGVTAHPPIAIAREADNVAVHHLLERLVAPCTVDLTNR